MKSRMILFVAVYALAFVTSNAFSHCEIPCGIYDDRMRVEQIAEHITTIEKSMDQITTLSADEDKNYNQLVRWINNKELHANKLQTIVYQYFMNQRITPVDDKDSPKYTAYVEKITLLHKMLVSAMKCKQTTDNAHIADLREHLALFETAYFGKQAGHDHGHEH